MSPSSAEASTSKQPPDLQDDNDPRMFMCSLPPDPPKNKSKIFKFWIQCEYSCLISCIYLDHGLPAETTFTVAKVTKPVLGVISSRRVELYQISLSTDFKGFDLNATQLYRRFSEFDTLRKVLAKRGVQTLPLTRIRWHPWMTPRVDELNAFNENLGEISKTLNDDCLKQLKRFFQDPTPFWEE